MWRSSTPRTRSRRASASAAARTAGACASRSAPERSWTDMARLKDQYNEQIRAALVSKFGYSTPMQAPKLQKVTLNMGVGEAKQDSKMLEAAQEQLATIAGRKPNIPRPQVRRRVQAARGHARRPVGHAARRDRLRVHRPSHLDRPAAPARLPGAQPA